MSRSLGVVLVLVGAVACGGQTTNAGGSGSDAGGEDGATPLSGVYKGYHESFTFPDGSDTVVMTLTFEAGGAITGTVFFGNGPPLAPPTNPNVGYPPDIEKTESSNSDLLEGFDFTILQGTYTAPRVQIQIQSTEVWMQWCELQTPYPFGNCGSPPTGYACLPNSATMENSGVCSYKPCDASSWIKIDCGKLELCGGMGPQPCVCTEKSCTVPVGPKGNLSFDMQLVDGALNGSNVGIDGSQILNVHLMRE